jgi:hypothetical protein
MTAHKASSKRKTTGVSSSGSAPDLAGEASREEAELLERRLLGVEDSGRNLPIAATSRDAVSVEETAD